MIYNLRRNNGKLLRRSETLNLAQMEAANYDFSVAIYESKNINPDVDEIFVMSVHNEPKPGKNASAFPQIETGCNYDGEHNGDISSSGGLTKREYLAAKALQGFLSNAGYSAHYTELVHDAVLIADALIEQLNKTEENL